MSAIDTCPVGCPACVHTWQPISFHKLLDLDPVTNPFLLVSFPWLDSLARACLLLMRLGDTCRPSQFAIFCMMASRTPYQLLQLQSAFMFVHIPVSEPYDSCSAQQKRKVYSLFSIRQAHGALSSESSQVYRP